jgi:hypothetical protein
MQDVIHARYIFLCSFVECPWNIGASELKLTLQSSGATFQGSALLCPRAIRIVPPDRGHRPPPRQPLPSPPSPRVTAEQSLCGDGGGGVFSCGGHYPSDWLRVHARHGCRGGAVHADGGAAVWAQSWSEMGWAGRIL